MKSRAKNICGQKFNKWKAIGFHFKKKNSSYWICLCDCGKLVSTLKNSVVSGQSKSCGCVKKSRLHGYFDLENKINRKLCHIFLNMKYRCYNTKSTGYKDYGGRGIQIYQEWLDDLTKFVDWALVNGYKNGLSIDRIDNDGNYCPENCRWSTRKTQLGNQRRSIRVVYKNRIYTLGELCEKLDLNRARIYYKLKWRKTNIADDIVDHELEQKCTIKT